MIDEYPRVSDVLKLFFGDSFFTEGSAERGQFYHDVIEAALKNNDYTDMSDEPFLAPLAEWLNENVIEVKAVEKQYYNRVIGYTGRPDAYLYTRNYGVILADWKTGKSETKAHKVQAMAYERLLNGNCKTSCYRFYLGNGKVDIKHEDDQDKYWPCFVAGVKFWEATRQLENL